MKSPVDGKQKIEPINKKVETKAPSTKTAKV
jgi:hypothetical protein